MAIIVPTADHRPPTARRCRHLPPCPGALAPDRDAARPLALHPQQGWSLLCNGVIVFDDTGELLPDGTHIPPHRPTDAVAVPAQRQP